jgi:putative spermidine/putrescine transport system ATP-binding protein
MKGEIRRLHCELGITILYVTHDQEEALTLSDRIALMHQGTIVQIGTPSDLYERPNSHFVASFIGESTLAEGTVVATPDGGLALDPGNGPPPLPGCGRVRPGEGAVLVLRPEKLRVASEASPEGLAATVADLVYVGEISRLELMLTGGLRIMAKQPNRRDVFRPSLAQAVQISWAREGALLLPRSASCPSPICPKELAHD